MWIEVGSSRGGIQPRWDPAEVGCNRGGMQPRWDVTEVGCNRGGMQPRWDPIDGEERGRGSSPHPMHDATQIFLELLHNIIIVI